MENLSSNEAIKNDFRLFLQHELEQRCKRNPKYSLRAFANALGLHNASLSLILRGKRPLSPKMVVRLGQRLDLGPEELGRFHEYVKKEEKIKVRKKHFTEKYYQEISLDAFKVISEWHHDAIVELLRTEGFSENYQEISRVLGISSIEVQIAVERLLRLGILGRDAIGKLVDQSGDTSIKTNEFTKLALRKLQKNIMKQSLEALQEVDESRRTHSSMTLAVNPEDFPKAKKLIRDFRQELCSYLQRPDNKLTEVYLLQVALFPIIGTLPRGVQNEQEPIQ